MLIVYIISFVVSYPTFLLKQSSQPLPYTSAQIDDLTEPSSPIDTLRNRGWAHIQPPILKLEGPSRQGTATYRYNVVVTTGWTLCFLSRSKGLRWGRGGKLLWLILPLRNNHIGRYMINVLYCYQPPHPHHTCFELVKTLRITDNLSAI